MDSWHPYLVFVQKKDPHVFRLDAEKLKIHSNSRTKIFSINYHFSGDNCCISVWNDQMHQMC